MSLNNLPFLCLSSAISSPFLSSIDARTYASPLSSPRSLSAAWLPERSHTVEQAVINDETVDVGHAHHLFARDHPVTARVIELSFAITLKAAVGLMLCKLVG